MLGSFGRITRPTKKPMKNDSAISVIAVVCVVGVGQHASNKFINGWEPLDHFEAVSLVDGEAHKLFSYSMGTLNGAGELHYTCMGVNVHAQ